MRVWDVETGELLITLSGHELPARSVTFSPDGRRILSATRKEMRVWETELSFARRAWHAIARDRLAASGGDGVVRGGGAQLPAWYGRSAVRRGKRERARFFRIGFRPSWKAP